MITLRPLRLLLGLMLLLSACHKPAATSETESPLTTIAFGSCNRQDLPQPLWDDILNNKPQLWVWLGDNIYGDSDDMNVLQKKYAVVQQQPEYQKLVATAKVVGTWDDHDYGRNDAGKEYRMKQKSADLFWNFVGEPANSPRRKQQGVYSAHTYGPKDRQVKVIMLDSRFNRDSLLRINKIYQVNQTGDVLGEEQWKWLENELRNSTAKVHIIGNGIQVLPEEHAFEKWANFPAARKRLLNLIASTKAQGVILLSGDRHIAEISRTNYPGISYPLYEVTSSGLTHTWTGTFVEEPNRYRVGPMIAKLNFGVLHFDWSGPQVKVDMQVKGDGNETYLREQIQF
ncbi:alkaline phosphatase D family protein [Pontibacter ruber]|uniref:Alkaline phosphatase D family protein n=1 Tax=Pontibacter ruber TaxID=1343895 RepID=A0ABW5CVP5_9BACT|nr:alkaline phosphatase D family protein [Pontibacter ruber]